MSYTPPHTPNLASEDGGSPLSSGFPATPASDAVAARQLKRAAQESPTAAGKRTGKKGPGIDFNKFYKEQKKELIFPANTPIETLAVMGAPPGKKSFTTAVLHPTDIGVLTHKKPAVLKICGAVEDSSINGSTLGVKLFIALNGINATDKGLAIIQYINANKPVKVLFGPCKPNKSMLSLYDTDEDTVFIVLDREDRETLPDHVLAAMNKLDEVL